MKILIEHREQAPWSFTGLPADKGAAADTFDARTERTHLKTGDYTIEGLEHMVCIERKSPLDLAETILSFKDRRPRFEQELERMGQMKSAAVIIEGTPEDVLMCVDDRGRQSAAARRKGVMTTIMKHMHRRNVQWIFAGSRRAAELIAFRFLQTFSQKAVAKDEIAKGGNQKKENAVEKKDDFADLFGGTDEKAPETPQNASAPEPTPEPDQNEKAAPAEAPAAAGLQITIASADDGIRYASLQQLRDGIQEIDALVGRLQDTRKCLAMIQKDLTKDSDSAAVKGDQLPLGAPSEDQKEPAPATEEAPEPVDAEKLAEQVINEATKDAGEPGKWATVDPKPLVDALKGLQIPGLGQGKLKTLTESIPTVGEFRKRVLDARSIGRPDHANMPKGIGPDIVSGILSQMFGEDGIDD